jgi:hypothetical protein
MITNMATSQNWKKKKKTPQDLSPHIVIVVLVRPDIEGVKNVEHLLLALNPGFCLPDVQKGPGELASWIPGHTSANQDFHVP